ncbi:MAG TPA: hypothetical protein DEQ80_07425 [Anaerolinea thermolimosa]|uniref:Uncharacterized protein n=1 Tax=Anaerolinea thermolimosa TaxID=229919 RepID=A0A3D1JGQ8_9CHLR|nr:hypothetical protein [Anaerolinea thermolimosa]GAP08673.1 hypothetical protein ATHL_03579 [Anaerolinea thermolimosa]HCE17673.1 hypothetical protein [Anaerolinea thermolimosa]
MRAPLWTAIAISVGLIVLLGYFIPPEMTRFAFILTLRSILIGWAVILAGVAALVGVLNLFMVHLRRMTARRDPDRYSILLVIAFLASFGLGLYLTPADPQYQKVVTAIQAPVEATLMALLVITLTFGSIRLFQRRKGLMAVVFAVSAFFFILIASGLLAPLQSLPGIGGLFEFIQRLPIAGTRGILLGIALGSLTAGLRILLGADRPFSG